MKLKIKFAVCLLIISTSINNLIDAHLRIGITSGANYCGEREVGWRIKIAAENLGWQAVLDESHGRQLQNEEDLDFVICLLPKNPHFVTGCPNYLTIFHPFNYLDDERQLLPFYEKYDGYLMTIYDRKNLADQLALKNKEFHALTFFPTIQAYPYQRLELKSLMMMIPVWGNRLSDEKFQELYNRLSKTGFARFYGINRNQKIIEHGYAGQLPFDGVSVVAALQDNGIVLVIHSDIHNSEGIPTSRIFEAAAASAVIISDENPFVKEHFGSSVFFIDTTKSAEEICMQIQEHLNTIYLDPQKAWDMAKEAHDIFIENFEMSKQLQQIEKMHQQLGGQYD